MNRSEYLLTCLTEECAEVQQAVAKALRFGLDDGYPGRDTTNAQDIASECVDILAIIELLQSEGLIEIIGPTTSKKKMKVLHYMEYSKERGTLKE